MKLKLVALVLVAVFCLMSVKASFGDNYGVKFVSCVTSDNETSPDVGSVSAYIDNDKYLICSVDDGYCGYEGYVDFVVENTATDEIVFHDIVVTVDDGTAISVVVSGVSIGDTIAPGGTVSGRVSISVLGGAAQGASYSFSVDFVFVENFV